MDLRNPYHTPLTFGLVRLEHLTLMVGLIALTALHWDDLRLGPFVLAFVAIDAVGYVPGAIAYRRAGGGRIAPVYHHLYNVAHSYLTAAVVAGLWALAHGGPEWAMTAIPIHLAGDRGLFGNTYKPLELPFEPVAVDPRAVLAAAPAGDRQEVAA